MEHIQLLQNRSNNDGQDHQENGYTVSGMQILTSTANISRMQAHIDFLFGTIVYHYSLYMYLKYGLLTGSESSDSYPKRFLTVFA